MEARVRDRYVKARGRGMVDWMEGLVAVELKLERGEVVGAEASFAASREASVDVGAVIRFRG